MLSSKKLDTETRQNVFQIYLASYKKFKYWFAVFYFLSILFWLLLYNEEISLKIEKYKKTRNLLSEIKRLKFFYASNGVLNSKNFISNLEGKFKFNKISDADWSRGILQDKARQYRDLRSLADSMNIYTDFRYQDYIESLKEVLRNDSIMIEDTIFHYDILINQYSQFGDSRDQIINYRNRIRAKFVKSVNQTQPQKIIEILPLEEMSSAMLKRYPLPDSISKEIKLKDVEKRARDLVTEVENWEKKDIIDPQNFRVPLSFGAIKELSLLMIAVIAMLLQLHFLNFKFYQDQYIDSKQALTKVPSIDNIIINLRIPLLSSRSSSKVIQFISYAFNLFAPLLIMYLIGKQVWRLLDNYTWFYTALIVYMIGFGSLLLYIWQDKNLNGMIRRALRAIRLTSSPNS